MQDITAVILAAGEGKRMKSKNSKLIQKICGKTLIEWVYKAVTEAGVKDCIVVVGHRADQVRECMGDKAQYALQDERRGTGHALMAASKYFMGKGGNLVVLSGDTPLITPETIRYAVKCHIENGCPATVITAEIDDPSGYGRIIRDKEGYVARIVEQSDASSDERLIKEINSGIYCFAVRDLIEALSKVRDANSQSEYYLTDVIGILSCEGKKIGAVKVRSSEEIAGINDRVQLYQASRVMQRKIAFEHMKAGVTIIDPDGAYIDDGVRIGADTVIYPGTFIEGETVIGEDCVIGPNSRIAGSVIGNGVAVDNSIILESTVGEGTRVGPFAYIRPGSSIGKGVRIGDFVEVKKSVIGDGTKASHLAYIGDAEVGRNVNIGCGTVFVNYDGIGKYRTSVGDNAFIGSNSNLVAPVAVGENGYIAAGSTITDNVPDNALAIARERQVVKEGWVIRKGRQRKGKD